MDLHGSPTCTRTQMRSGTSFLLLILTLTSSQPPQTSVVLIAIPPTRVLPAATPTPSSRLMLSPTQVATKSDFSSAETLGDLNSTVDHGLTTGAAGLMPSRLSCQKSTSSPTTVSSTLTLTHTWKTSPGPRSTRIPPHGTKDGS